MPGLPVATAATACDGTVCLDVMSCGLGLQARSTKDLSTYVRSIMRHPLVRREQPKSGNGTDVEGKTEHNADVVQNRT